MKVFTRDEVASHTSPENALVIVDNKVYNIAKFYKMHPGGAALLLQYAGKDVTKDFYSLHRASVLKKYARLAVGTVAGLVSPPESLGAISKIPYAETGFWQGFKSPYYKDSHLRLRKACRAWIDEHLRPSAMLRDNAGKSPSPDDWLKMGSAGLLAARLGPGPHLNTPGCALLGGQIVSPTEFDYFHEMIVHEEFARLGCPGYIDGTGIGFVIGLPVIMNYGSPAMKAKVIPEVLRGEKKICLAITEPFAGSDVKKIRCFAKKVKQSNQFEGATRRRYAYACFQTPDGKHFVVNGVKKWITNGTFCDYFTTAVRTEKGISMLLVERGPGLKTNPIKTSYSPAAGTAYVIMENVKVPVENLIGAEGKGFQCIMANFNHERWMITVQTNRWSRLMIEEAFKWANQRIVFNKPLLDQPVIRNKLANMIGLVESVQNWIESTTHQMNSLSYKDQGKMLAGPIALLKLRATRAAYKVCDDANQILGGRAITQSGMGQVIQKISQAIKFSAIYGGSEEIMGDLGVRQAMKYFPQSSRL